MQAERTVVHPFPVDCYEGLPWPPPASVLLEASINEEKFAAWRPSCTSCYWPQAVRMCSGPQMGALAADYFSL